MRKRPVLTAALAAALALAGLVTSASAQDWATREFCQPPRIEVIDSVFDPEGRAELESRAAGIPNGVGRFWQVTGPDGAVSHLWGTMHSSHPSVLDLPDEVVATLTDARLIALEIDPTFPDRASHGRFMRGADVYRPAESTFRFADLGLPRDIERHISARLTALGWHETAIDDLTYGALTDLLLFDPCEDFTAGVLPTQDSYIQTLAHIEGIPVMALEPVNRLAKKLDQTGNEDLARAVIATYSVYLLPGSSRDSRAASFALYQQGRVGLMMAWDEAAVIGTLGAEGPALYDRMNAYLVEERNIDFFKASVEALREGGVFLAVGNFHLPGETGLVAQLRNAGFEVTRIPLPGEAP
ncbi:TraB/GumN family protein [Maliponia aquimaris]|uniref:TraB family protein n=1 Tax=Maliponia aquimaris TaxID=1673631 RepID=A0A238K5I8_9RHOB|nr:TraB/GumN family protein [Maliponia aquimaris]SMX38119.1 TraB family protein [Maliponia aquimaris]